MKKRLLQFSVCLLSSLLFFSTAIYASGIQVFTTINYANPADLVRTKKVHIDIGGVTYIYRFTLDGESTVPGIGTLSGRARSRNTVMTPYFLLGVRVNDRVVVGLSVTEPFVARVDWGANSFARFDGTLTRYDSIDLSPELAVRLNKIVSIGAGLDVLYSFGALNVFLRNPNFGFVGEQTNSGEDWTLGWHLGTLFHIAKGTFLDFTYFSSHSPVLKGKSDFIRNPVIRPGQRDITALVPLPTTLIAVLTQFFSPTIALQATLAYSIWQPFQALVINNSIQPNGTPVTLNVNFDNTWLAGLTFFDQLTKAFALVGGVGFDEAAGPIGGATVSLPGGHQLIFGVGGRFTLSKNLKFGVDYALSHILNGAPIGSVNAAGVSTVGRARINTSVVTFQLIIDY